MKKYIIIVLILIIIISIILVGLMYKNYISKNAAIEDTEAMQLNINISTNKNNDSKNNVEDEPINDLSEGDEKIGEEQDDDNDLEDFNYNNVINDYNESKENDIKEYNNEVKDVAKGYLFEYESNITDEDMITNYLYNFSELALYSVKDSYDRLNDEFKNKFNNFVDYEDFINRNREWIFSLYSNKYSNIKVNNNKNIKTYSFEDSEGNKFTIKENAIMDYKINIE